VPKRRFQKGCFVKQRFEKEHMRFLSMYYVDAPDGTTKRVCRTLGSTKEGMSERVARREHVRIIDEVNHQRGSIAPVPKHQSFAEAVKRWNEAIAPNLSPSTVRQRDSHFRFHIMPRLQHLAVQDIGVHELQQFATELKKTVSRNTSCGVLCTVFGVLEYAEKCKMKVSGVKPADIEYGAPQTKPDSPFFTREQVANIIAVAKEPFKTLFALAWYTGARAGELLALTVSDLDFNDKKIRINKVADDNTRAIRMTTKTKYSNTSLPMSKALEQILRAYILRLTPSSAGYLFPAPRNVSRPRSRDNVVRAGLKPVLKKLGLPFHDVGLHAFRHGLATQLCEASVPVTVLQNQMRHADVSTTLKIYAHAIPQSQRDAIESVELQSVYSNGRVLKFAAK
jgi:integrase